MFSIQNAEQRRGGGLARREMLRVGGLTVGGLSLAELLAARDVRAAPLPALSHPQFGRAKSVIFLYLAGGPPQHETFDPKPEAPAEIRGPFQPIQTNIPGVQFSELLPRTAQQADKLAVIRSMATDDHIHSSSGAWVLTGYKYRGPNARVQMPNDWPYIGSIVKMLRPSDLMPGLSTVWLPDVMRLNENVTPTGQTGGFLGPQWNPEVFVGDPSAPHYEIESLRSAGMGPDRLQRRRSLLSRLDVQAKESGLNDRGSVFDVYRQQAFDLLTSGRAQAAFDIAREDVAVREHYGQNRWGQCVLLARRLVEAGVRLVHVHWPREPGDNAVDNPLWDTHAQNADRVEDVLCPMFDVGFSALIEDLNERGLLDETLVVAIGEFGRTPKINGNGGRDHWGSVFSCVLAGAGISGGQVFGASDRIGAYPVANRVRPGDLSATLFHLLGVPSMGSFRDRQGREHRVTEGEPIYELLGAEPATPERVASTADVSRVPPFDPARLLTATGFARGETVRPVSSPSRPKGWRAGPAILQPEEEGFGMWLPAQGASPHTSEPHVALGVRVAGGQDRLPCAPGARALLAQEVRSPFAGTYRLRVRVAGDASSAAAYRELFLEQFVCRLMFIQFNSLAKQADDARSLASVTFVPTFQPDDWQTVELQHTFVNPSPGGNFSFGAGLGIAMEVAHTGDGRKPGPLEETVAAMLRIVDVQLSFIGKERNQDVTA